MSGSHPPAWLARGLEAVLPPTDRSAAILGDLHEEYGLRFRRSPWRAKWWYAREGLGIAVRYVGESRKYRRRRGSLGARRTVSWEGLVDTLISNVRYALRRLAKAPMFVVVAVLSLGLGIGANTAIFSLVNAVVIRDQPFEDPERLVDIYEATEGFSHGTLSYPDYVDVVEGSEGVFDAVAGSQFTLLQVDIENGVDVVPAEAVTGNYFALLGVQAALGRLITEEDHVAPGAHPVVVLGYDYWTTRYGRDPAAVGSELRLSGRPYTIIGIVPQDYPGSVRGLEPAAFVPIMMQDELDGNASSVLDQRGNQSFFAKARLSPGATVAQATALVDRLTATLRQEYPQQWDSSKEFVIVPTADVIMNPMLDRFIVPAAGLVMVVVGLVLLIACANLASFLLARAADRRKEIAVRLAMGARRRTLVGQLLTETVLLAIMGGLVGVLLARVSLDFLMSADLPLPLPITLDLALDTTVLAFSVAVSAAAGLLFGLVPALQSTNPDLAPTLRDETAGGGRAKSAALRNLLVVGQVSVSVVLLVASGLFLRSLDASRAIDPGFGDAPTGILRLNVPGTRFTEEEGRVYIGSLIDRIASLPGVTEAGHVSNLPMNTLSTQNVRVLVDGVEPPAGQAFHLIDRASADDGYLAAAGIALEEGRGFAPSDVEDGEPVALVSAAFARRFFPDGNAVGRTITVRDAETQVIGVVADHKIRRLGEEPRPYLLLSARQSYSSFITVLARTSQNADRLAVDMLEVARALDPEAMVYESMTMERHLAVMLLGRELGALVVTAFALLALLLASIGLYGVVSYSVARRTREVGIRLSLGADDRSVVRMLTGSGMRLVALGAVVGLVVSAALSQLVSRLLYGVPPLDPLTFVGVPAVLGVVALLASWIPARRVTRIDPVGALRSE